MAKTPLEMDIVECPTDDQIPVMRGEPDFVESPTDDQIPVYQSEMGSGETPTDDEIPVFRGANDFDESPTDDEIPVFLNSIVAEECTTDDQIPVLQSGNAIVESPTDDEIPILPTGIQHYMDKAASVLQRLGMAQSRRRTDLVRLLDDVKYVNESKVPAIAQTIQQISTFNQLVRDNVEGVNIGSRYLEITQTFDSIRDDLKVLIKQLDDGKFSLAEKAQNLWMRIRRGTPSARFEKITDAYKQIASDTKNQLDREVAIVDGYIDFRFSLKEAEILVREVMEEHAPALKRAQGMFDVAQPATNGTEGTGESNRELASDEARRVLEKEERTHRLLTDIADYLSFGFDVGETLITKLKQTHDVKERVYRCSVAFFSSNESIFTILGTPYLLQQVLNEATRAAGAMKPGSAQGFADVTSHELERAALKAGYGSTISPQSVEKLMTAISDYQTDSIQVIAELHKESEACKKIIGKSIEEGKKRLQETVKKFAPDSLN